MRRRPLLVLILALVTLGSGIINLYSVIGPGLPERRAVLKELFPLDFVHLSRFLTLLIGFALVISSINIYKRKKRAFQAVFLLALGSILFHLTKGLDYEEAAFSVILLVSLWLGRKHFTVKSSLPDWRAAMVRLTLAGVIAVGYGVAGFWFLDPKEFGIDFTLPDSIHRTLLFLSLAGDPMVAPHTRYAVWFVDSLYLMTVTAIVYAGFTLFRPAMYRFRTHPHEIEEARKIIERHGRSSLDYFKAWADKSFYFSPSRLTFIAYRVAANFAVALGDPVGPEEEIEMTVRGFRDFCMENDWGLALHQALPDFLPIYQRLGFKKMKIGDDALIDLARFKLEGKKARDLRNKLNQFEKLGITACYYEPPIPEHILRQVKEVSDEWLQIPGRRERQFTLGRFEEDYVRSTPVLSAFDKDGRMLGFLNVIPSYAKGESTIDLMRHRVESPNGVMDYLFVKIFLINREKGHQRFNLGMAPMSGFEEKEEASPQERAVHRFFQQLNFLFSYRGLRAYKAKFASYWEPRYVVYSKVLDLPRLAVALGKVTEVHD